jgi:hypothetical protein
VTVTRVLLVAGAIGAAMVSSASAVEAFVGRWAVKPEACYGFGSTATTTALVATETSLSWFDGTCRIGKMYKARAVYVQAHCSGKGDVPVTLDAAGDRMTVTWGRGKAARMQRCK